MGMVSDMWNLIAGPIISGISGFFKDRAAIKKAKVEGEIAAIQSASQNLADWEQLHAKGSQTSWKDEFWTIIFAIPLIFAFIQTDWFDGPSIAAAGFAAFDQMPDWYQYTLVTMVLASFGIRVTDKVRGMIKK